MIRTPQRNPIQKPQGPISPEPKPNREDPIETPQGPCINPPIKPPLEPNEN